MFRWPQKCLTATTTAAVAAIVTSVVPNDGFPVAAFVAAVVSVVRAAKTSEKYLLSLWSGMRGSLLAIK